MPPEQNKSILLTSQWARLMFIVAGGIFLGLGSLALVGYLIKVLAAVFMAITIAAALSPIVDFIAQKMPRTLAIIVVYVSILLIFVALGAVVVPTLVIQADSLIDRLPAIFNQIEQWINQQQVISSSSLFDAAASQIQTIASYLIAFPVDLFDGLFDVVLVITISMYTLFERDAIQRFALSLFPISQRQFVLDVSKQMVQSMGGYIRGIVINVLIIGTASFIGLTIIGVEYALVLSIFAALLEIIPVVGALIAAVPAILIALTQSPLLALITAVFFLILQQIEGNLLTPNIMQSQAEVSPLLVLVALFAGASIGGITGALVAIPFAAALRVFVVRVIAPAIRSRENGSIPVADEQSP